SPHRLTPHRRSSARAVAGSAIRTSAAMNRAGARLRVGPWGTVGVRLTGSGVRVAFPLVAAAVVLLVRAPDLRLRDDTVAAQADDVVQLGPPLVGVLLDEARQAAV